MGLKNRCSPSSMLHLYGWGDDRGYLGVHYFSCHSSGMVRVWLHYVNGIVGVIELYRVEIAYRGLIAMRRRASIERSIYIFLFVIKMLQK